LEGTIPPTRERPGKYAGMSGQNHKLETIVPMVAPMSLSDPFSLGGPLSLGATQHSALQLPHVLAILSEFVTILANSLHALVSNYSFFF